MEIKKTLETDNSNNNSSDDKTEETTVKEDKKTEIEAEVNKAIKEPEPEAELNQPEIYLKTEEIEKKPSCFNKKLFVILLITLVVAEIGTDIITTSHWAAHCSGLSLVFLLAIRTLWLFFSKNLLNH